MLTAAVLGGLLLFGLFVLEPRRTVLAFAVVTVAGAWEWAGFGGLRAPAARAAYALAMAFAMVLAWRIGAEPRAALALYSAAALWWLGAFAWVLRAPGSVPRWPALAAGVPVLVPAFVAVGRLLLAEHGFARGPVLVLWMLLLVFAADIGAFFAGRRFGRHKLAPRVSPGKTWEGAVGGLAAVALVAAAGAWHFGLALAPAVGFGCLLGAFSVVGDLTESLFKRSAGLKDSGNLLPGHGGILDRIDSITAAAPLFALGLFGGGVIA